MKKGFYTTGLIAGTVQLLMNFAALPVLAFPSLETPKPVRISRPLLKKEIHGQITAGIQGSKAHFFQSAVYWREFPTTLPAPQPGAIADFRDFEGCLEFQDVQNLAVCFNVMPDVSSVGVNAKEMKLHGVENFMNEVLKQDPGLTRFGEFQPSRCEMSVQNVQFVRAARMDNRAVRIEFSGEVLSSARGLDCKLQPRKVNLTFEFNWL